MPAGASSAERVRVRPCRAALAAAYGPLPAMPSAAMVDDRLTMRPHERARMAGSTAWMAAYEPPRLASMRARHSSRSTRSNGSSHDVPHCTALLTSASIRPQRSRAEAATVSIDAGSARSKRAAAASPPAARISSATAAARASSL